MSTEILTPESVAEARDGPAPAAVVRRPRIDPGLTPEGVIARYGITCDTAAAWLRTRRDLADAASACTNPEWLAYGAHHLRLLTRELSRRAACALVRRVPVAGGRTLWDLLDDARSRAAVEAAERHLAGLADDADLAGARRAAEAAWEDAHAACGPGAMESPAPGSEAALRSVAAYAAMEAAAADPDGPVTAVALVIARAGFDPPVARIACDIIREIVPVPWDEEDVGVRPNDLVAHTAVGSKLGHADGKPQPHAIL